jgi:hypothetical protein
MNPIQLREMIRDAARLAFTTVQKKHPEESFYVFALQSLDDASGVYAAANTEAGYATCRSKHSHREEKYRPGERYYRWYWGEWAFQNIEAPLFRGVYDLLNRHEQSAEEELLPSWWHTRKGRVFASMVAALADLDEEGVFGRGAERARITLFCTIEDSSCNEWVQDESVARLNPPDVYRTFAGVDVAEVYAKWMSPFDKPVHDAFVQLLGEWGLARRT